ncbi:MAG: squalene/phytoene synthase family protein [Aggregatilineales bacterium]
MTLRLQHSWEYRLITLAEEAFNSQLPSIRISANDHELEAAYRHCDEITKQYSRTFYMASGLLPAEKRRSARALYAFCRVTDDIVDEFPDKEQARIELSAWRLRVSEAHPQSNDPVALAWADTRARFNIPCGYAEQLIDGVARDLVQSRYETFDDLAAYSYGVASTVGLMAMHIIGFSGEEALPYAVRLGVALQITNILRDVAEDWTSGRLYLPLEELENFGLSENDIHRGVVDDRWREFMRFQLARNHQLYSHSMAGIAQLDADGRFAIGAAAELYRAILTDIEKHDYDVFSRRAHVGLVGKVVRLPGIWRRTRRTESA